MFANILCLPKLANVPPCYVFLIQIIDGNCILSHSLAKLANLVQDRKVDTHPPQPWGAFVYPDTAGSADMFEWSLVGQDSMFILLCCLPLGGGSPTGHPFEYSKAGRGINKYPSSDLLKNKNSQKDLMF